MCDTPNQHAQRAQQSYYVRMTNLYTLKAHSDVNDYNVNYTSSVKWSWDDTTIKRNFGKNE